VAPPSFKETTMAIARDPVQIDYGHDFRRDNPVIASVPPTWRVGMYVQHCGVECCIVAVEAHVLTVHYLDKVGMIQQITVPKDAIV
jgi:hypothetical protein